MNRKTAVRDESDPRDVRRGDVRGRRGRAGHVAVHARAARGGETERRGGGGEAEVGIGGRWERERLDCSAVRWRGSGVSRTRVGRDFHAGYRPWGYLQTPCIYLTHSPCVCATTLPACPVSTSSSAFRRRTACPCQSPGSDVSTGVSGSPGSYLAREIRQRRGETNKFDHNSDLCPATISTRRGKEG
mgnify:CR=1 FL=1|jgi:hypothetical protein